MSCPSRVPGLCQEEEEGGSSYDEREAPEQTPEEDDEIRDTYMLNVQIVSASNLTDPGYQFGDISKWIFCGKSRLEKLYAEVQLGDAPSKRNKPQTLRKDDNCLCFTACFQWFRQGRRNSGVRDSQQEVSSRAFKLGANSFKFVPEPLDFLHHGQEEFTVRVRDFRGMQLGGDPVVGEATARLEPKHYDGQPHNQVVNLKPTGRLEMQFKMRLLSEEEEDAALEIAYHAEFCNRTALPPSEFTVIIAKNEYGNLGMEMLPRDNDTLKIQRIGEGPVTAWNVSNPDRQLKEGYVVLEVNGVRGNAEDINNACKEGKELKIVVKRREGRTFHAEQRRKVMKFGCEATVDPDEKKAHAFGRNRGCIEVMKEGVPDKWKAFAWHHLSGAAALQRKLDRESNSLESWYKWHMSATFGDDYLPEVFANGADGKAPLFNDGIAYLGGRNLVLEEKWPDLVKMLTPDGLSKAKRILWTLHSKWSSSADFCPWVPPVVLAFLQFSTEHETFAALHCLLSRAGRNIKTLPSEAPLARIFLFRTREQFSRVVQQFISAMKNDSFGADQHLHQLESKDIDVHAYIAGKLSDCLASLLPARAFLRLLGSSLITGWKASARYLMGLFNHVNLDARALDDCMDSASAKRRYNEKLLECAQALTGTRSALDQFIKDVFRPNLPSRNAPYANYEGNVGLDQCLDSHFAWPSGAISSLRDPDCLKTLDLASMISLWSSLLPVQVRNCRLQLVFTPAKHGYTLEALVSNCEKLQQFGIRVPMLFLVAASLGSDPDIVLGAYSPCLFMRTSGDKYVDAAGVQFAESFVFTAPRAPERKAGEVQQNLEVRTSSPITHYTWSSKNDMLFHLGTEKLLFGGPNPAISLDGDLRHGSSSFCESFKSPALLTEGGASVKDFKISRIEVFAFVDD